MIDKGEWVSDKALELLRGYAAREIEMEARWMALEPSQVLALVVELAARREVQSPLVGQVATLTAALEQIAPRDAECRHWSGQDWRILDCLEEKRWMAAGTIPQRDWLPCEVCIARAALAATQAPVVSLPEGG